MGRRVKCLFLDRKSRMWKVRPQRNEGSRHAFHTHYCNMHCKTENFGPKREFALRVAHRSWMRRSYHPVRTNCCVFVEPESTFMHIGGNDESFQPAGPIWSESFSPLAQHLATTYLSEPVSTCDPTPKPGFTILDRQYTRALEGQLQGEYDVASGRQQPSAESKVCPRMRLSGV